MAVKVPVPLAAGGLVLAGMPRDGPDRYTALAGHMTSGLVIGVLLISRLLTRILVPRNREGAPAARARRGERARDEGAPIFVRREYGVSVAAPRSASRL